MENDTKKEVWMDDVMDSLKGMKRASAGGDMYARVMQRTTVATATARFPIKIWAAAAILLLAVNISSAIYATAKKRSIAASVHTGNELAIEIQSASTYYNY